MKFPDSLCSRFVVAGESPALRSLRSVSWFEASMPVGNAFNFYYFV